MGKYGTRYGASLRKLVKKIETTQHAKVRACVCGRARKREQALNRDRDENEKDNARREARRREAHDTERMMQARIQCDLRFSSA